MNAISNYFKYILVILVLIFFVPFFIVSNFNFPQSDDWDFAGRIITYGYWGALKNYVLTLSGRYFALFISIFCNPMIGVNLFIIKLVPILFIILSVGAYFIFFKSIMIDSSNFNIFIISSMFAIFYVLMIPSVAEGFYWFSSTVNYQTGQFLILLLLTVFFNSNLILNFKNVSIISILLFLIVGMNEMILILSMISILVFTVLYLRKNRKLDLKISFIWMVYLASICLVIFSPGNIKRDKIYSNNHNINFTLESSLELLSGKIISWIPLLLFFNVLILIALNIKFKFKMNLSIKQCFFLIGIFILFFYFLYLPSPWFLGFKAGGRIENVIFFYCQIVMIFFSVFITERFNLKSLNLFNTEYFKPIVIAIFFIIFFTRENFQITVKELLNGDAKDYYVQNMSRIKQISENKMDTIVLKSLTVKPKTLYFDDFANDADNWLNVSISKVMKSNPIRMEN